MLTSKVFKVLVLCAVTVAFCGVMNVDSQALAGNGYKYLAMSKPTDPNFYGQTIGEWSAEWWNWAFSFPPETSPLVGDNNPDCALGQSGKVWFIAGTGGGPAERSCTIPKSKALFFPVVNTVWWGPDDAPDECASCPIDSSVKDCNPECFAALRELAFLFLDPSEDLSCSVDDVPCVYTHLLVRTQSPPSELDIPEGSLLNTFGIPAGVRPAAITDGYWVMLPPLSAGEHVIKFAATNAGFGGPVGCEIDDDCPGGTCVDDGFGNFVCDVPCEDDCECVGVGGSCGIFGSCVEPFTLDVTYTITAE